MLTGRLKTSEQRTTIPCHVRLPPLASPGLPWPPPVRPSEGSSLVCRRAAGPEHGGERDGAEHFGPQRPTLLAVGD